MRKYQPTTENSRGRLWLTVIMVFVTVALSLAIVLPATNLPFLSPFERFYPHLGLDLKGGAHLLYEADLSSVPSADQNSALAGARDIIERRVNGLGVSEPVVQISKAGDASRIIVELAGAQDINAAIKEIGETPLLEFMEGDSSAPTATTTTTAETVIEQDRELQEQAADIIERLNAGEKFEDLSNEFSNDDYAKKSGGDLGWAGKGLFTPLFENVIFEELKVGELRQTPLQTEFGYHIIKKTDERTNDKGEKEVRSSHILLKSAAPEASATDIRWINTSLSGKQLKRAQVVFNPQSNRPEISISFDSDGAKLFEQITERNIGRPVGIFLDSSLLSAPTVQTAISGGEAVITGNFTLVEAKLLAQRLNAGALPVPIKLISQQAVGASLGEKTLANGIYAGIIGCILVICFMIAYYRLPGLVASIALVIYALITLALFEFVPVTLTLAGIAGFILSIGMAVDANVLIFERTKEELRRGQGFVRSVEEGFNRAWPSIKDSNISSLITCLVLYWFGTSIVRGFAVTLALGVMVSMFSAITITRSLLRIIIQSRLVQRHWLFAVKK